MLLSSIEQFNFHGICRLVCAENVSRFFILFQVQNNKQFFNYFEPLCT
jgi:hypothetical protein